MIIQMRPDRAGGGGRFRPPSADGWSSRCSAGALTAVSLLILAAMAPHVLLEANTPTGGDMGAHVLGPAYLRDVLLPGGRIIGWSNHWFAGFPIFYFYFPLPSLVIVGLDLLLPYGAAFKLVSVMGLAALAPASYFLVRSMRFSRPVAAVAAAAGGAYAFMETPTPNIFGGTIASSLAGEFAYSWSFAFLLVYLGLLLRAVYDDRRYFPWAAGALAATALCHVIPTIAAVTASLFLVIGRFALAGGAFAARRLRLRPGRPSEGPSGRRAWWTTAGTWLFGFALASFWALPLVVRLRYTTDMNWHPLAGLDELFPVEFWPIAVLGAAGMAAPLRTTGRAVPFAALTLIPLPAFFLLSQGAKLWNGRVLPHWFFGMYLFAGIGVGLLAAAAVRRLPAKVSSWWIRGGVGAGALSLVFLADVRGALPCSPPMTGVQRLAQPLCSVWRWEGWNSLQVGGASVIDRISGSDLLILAAAVLVILQLGRKPAARVGAALPLSAVILLIAPAFIGAATGENYTSGWANWNFQGYEAKKTWPEYRNLMTAVSELPPGRVQWEANKELNQYGTPMAPMLFPYWTSGTHPSMEGLYFESSITTPFHFLNAAELSTNPSNPISGLKYHNGDYERGARHMELFNVAYYVAFTETARERADRHPAFERAAEPAPFTVYSLPESSLVDIAVNRPWVFEEPGGGLFDSLTAIFTEDETPGFLEAALAWYEDLGMLDQWVTADGPAEWERIAPELDGGSEGPGRALSSAGETAPMPIGEGGRVWGVVLEDHRIVFNTSAVGAPHMIKVSYFPNWRASGAEGPWRAAPSFMVVVPTQERVELRFENTWVEDVGAWSSFLAAALLALWAGSAGAFWRRQGAQAAAEGGQPA